MLYKGIPMYNNQSPKKTHQKVVSVESYAPAKREHFQSHEIRLQITFTADTMEAREMICIHRKYTDRV